MQKVVLRLDLVSDQSLTFHYAIAFDSDRLKKVSYNVIMQLDELRYILPGRAVIDRIDLQLLEQVAPEYAVRFAGVHFSQDQLTGCSLTL